MEFDEIIDQLKKQANPNNVAGMARFGISSRNTLGVSVTNLRKIAKEIKKETKNKETLHKTAHKLWESEIHEARILATILDVPELVSEDQADRWVRDVESWDVGDGLCLNLIDKTSFAFSKAKEWATDESEFVRRAGFATMAGLASHNKTAMNEEFLAFFPLIKKYSIDERNFVRKAVNWALRGTGKRNSNLLISAINLAKEISKIDSKSARWIATDALRELSKKT